MIISEHMRISDPGYCLTNFFQVCSVERVKKTSLTYFFYLVEEPENRNLEKSDWKVAEFWTIS